MRLGPAQRENALARALAERSAPYLDLTLSNPTAAGLPVGPVALPSSRVYEPYPLGLPTARAAVAAYQGVSPDRVVLTASTSEAYSWLFKLLCAAGDEVLVPDLTFVATEGFPLTHGRSACQLVVGDAHSAVEILVHHAPSSLKRQASGACGHLAFGRLVSVMRRGSVKRACRSFAPRCGEPRRRSKDR